MVGDVICLTLGMEIPADGIMISGNSIKIDESSMTGETKPMKKDIILNCIEKWDKIISEGKETSSHIHDVDSPIILSGTKVLDGIGTMVIIGVGKFSSFG